MTKELLKGNIAIAKGALACGCSCYFGYPITPQTEIGEYLSSEMPKRELAYVCAESELAAINMALGATATGAKALVTSSSCAVALMQETMSYAYSDELPIVLVNVMRAGPGQGYIFPSQGDYNQAVYGGGNGDYRTIVLSPSDVQECADMIQRAFYLSRKYKTPTMLLVDGALGQLAEPAEIKENLYPEISSSHWELIGSRCECSRNIHSLQPDQNKLNQHILTLRNKFEVVERDEVEYEEYRMEDAVIVLTAFGSMARNLKGVVDFYRDNGVKVGLFRPKTLYPFPYQRLREISQRAELFIDIEMNLGQMLKDVILATSPNAPVSFIGKAVGDWLTFEEIEEQITTLLKDQYANI